MERQDESRALAITALNEPPPDALLGAPLDYIFAEHFRQRSLCRILDELAGEPEWDREKAEAARRFLERDFHLHVSDEEADLFPLLRRRLKTEDDIGGIMETLSAEHAEERAVARTIADDLTAALAGNAPATHAGTLRARLRRFAAKERRHLITENAIVLPLARARLTAADLRELGRRMAARRAVERSGDADAL